MLLARFAQGFVLDRLSLFLENLLFFENLLFPKHSISLDVYAPPPARLVHRLILPQYPVLKESFLIIRPPIFFIVTLYGLNLEQCQGWNHSHSTRRGYTNY